jgi:thioredoxin-like negative regulator of GroEL
MLAENPQDEFLRYALALELAAAGDVSAALGQLQRLLADQPDYIPAYLQAAQFAAQLGQTEIALALVQAGVPRARAAGDAHAADELSALQHSLSPASKN